MLQLFDVNILINAHRGENSGHAFYRRWLKDLLQGEETFLYCELILSAFVRIVTHPRIYDPPSTGAQAMKQIETWMRSPGLVPLAESQSYWPALRQMLEKSRVVGPQVHDARVATLCRIHGVKQLWTADRDFSRFPGLPTKNPLL